MKKGLTELVFILDKSGSMHGSESDVVGGLSSLLEQQKKEPGECLVSIVLFSDFSELVVNREDIEKCPTLTEKDYVVGGSTALLDAIGSTIQRMDAIEKTTREEEIPEKTMVVISTDGHENCSRSFTRQDVKKMIEEHTEKKNWNFIFTASGIDAEEDAKKIGICLGNYVEVENFCIPKMYSEISGRISEYRND